MSVKAIVVVAFLVFGGGSTALADDRGEKSSCWRGEALTLCFDGQGTVTSSTFMYNDHDSSEGFQTPSRYWVDGDRIRFEVLEPRSMNVGWPWDWTRISCNLGGSSDVIALTHCMGNGQPTQVEATAKQRNLTLCLLPTRDTAPCQ